MKHFLNVENFTNFTIFTVLCLMTRFWYGQVDGDLTDPRMTLLIMSLVIMAVITLVSIKVQLNESDSEERDHNQD